MRAKIGTLSFYSLGIRRAFALWTFSGLPERQNEFNTAEREQRLSEDIIWGMKYLLYLPDPSMASSNKSYKDASLRLSLPLSSLTVIWSSGAGVGVRSVVSRDRNRPTHAQHTGATQ